MTSRLTSFLLNRAGWGDRHSLELDVQQISVARDPGKLPNLLWLPPTERLDDILSWPDRSGFALQCIYELAPVGADHPSTLMSAEAVRWSGRGDVLEIELVEGWRGWPRFWGNRDIHEEEVEAAIHGMAPDSTLQLLSVPPGRDATGAPRARILESDDDPAVLFVGRLPADATILAGVVARLCETGALAQSTNEIPPLDGRLTRTRFRRTDKAASRITRWLGGYGPRDQQWVEQRTGVPWPSPQRWSAELS
ncbi:MAG: hypothetical protein F4Y45_04595 [Acidobacteria bacterium]|nr:hypothetical protein [Acidobacteriota bacterium]MYJ06046.1 hypothetical protein [Acidobacteriota bacterium]